MMSSTRAIHVFTSEPIECASEDAWQVEGAASYSSSCLFGPAFFDPQVNGFGGVDFTDPDLTRDQLEHAVSEIHKAGCAHFLLTLVTAAPDFLEDQFKRIANFVDQRDMIRRAIPGFHLEGPFISPEPGYKGAHPEAHVCAPDWTLFTRLQTASGNRIRMTTLAPEWPGSEDFIRKAVASGVFVCLGHTNASYAQLRSATAAGARLFTHLGNGCPIEMHRHDNIIHRVLAIPELMASLIPDGIHLPPFVLANMARILGPSRLVLTTDAVAAAGAPAGRYRVNGQEVVVGEDRVVMHADGKHFAGSALTMIEGFRNTVRFGGLGADGSWHAWTRMRQILFPELSAPQLMISL